MSGINYDSINNKIYTHNETIIIRHYTGTTPQFDADQNPLNSFDDTSAKATILEPSALNIKSLGGLITTTTKKIVLPKGTTINVSDDIILSTGTTRVEEVQDMITRTVVFVNRYLS